MPNYTGDLISGIYDDAGELRQYLSDAYYQGTVWVLLGGDYSVVPIRYGCGTNNTWGDPTWREYEIPADNYFADFTGDWNVDGNEFYGQPYRDNPDYNPEIFVGRLLCASATDIANWTTKILIYEQNPGKGDISYLMRSFMMQSDQLQKGDEAGDVADHLPSSFSHTIWEEYPSYYAPMPTFPSGSEVINEMNLTRYGLWSWFAHGAPISICTKTNYVNTTPRNTVNTVDHINNGVEEFGDALDCLTNENYPSIVYTVGCDNTPFDIYNPMGWWPGRNLGEGFTVITKAGGPALLGNTRYGYVSGSSSLYQKFADLLTLGTNDPESGKSYLHIGVAELVSKQNYTNHYLNYSHNLIGCPETKIWTETPLQFSNVSITDGGSYITVNAGESGCDISVISLDNGLTYFQTASDVSSYSFNTSVRPLYLTITKSNVLPYIAITGGTISSDEIFTGKLNIIGNLTVAENVTLTIEPSTVIKFEEDVGLIINGKLIAEGTSSNLILFTSNQPSPSKGDWSSIRFNDSSDDNSCIVKYCEIEYASYGIYCYRAKPKIENNTISNNDDGIFLWYTSPSIKNNTITQNNRGVFGNHSNAYIKNNNISNNSWYGVQFWYSSAPVFYNNSLNSNSTNGSYFRSYSNPEFGPNYDYGYDTEKGYNVLKNNGCNGIYASYYSDPFMGSTGLYGGNRIGGYNSIYDNYSKNAIARNHSHIEAEHNWWAFQFDRIYSDGTSSIDYVPYLYSNPGGGSSLGKSTFIAGNNDSDDNYGDFNPMEPDTSKLSDLWLWANELWLNNQLHEAINVYKILIRKFSETCEARRSLVRLVHLYAKTETEGLSVYLNSQINNKNIDSKLKHIALDLLVGVYVEELKFNKAIHTCNKIIRKYPETKSKKLALFHLVFVYSADLQDYENAQEFLEIMKQKYPNDELTLLAQEEMGEDVDWILAMGEDVDWKLAKNGFEDHPPGEFSKIPEEFALRQNYPNPFNPETTIRFDLPEALHVSLVIYDITGREIAKLVDKNKPIGYHSIIWDGQDKHGNQVSSGVYLYRIQVGNYIQTKKMVLLR